MAQPSLTTQDPSKDSCFTSHEDQYISIVSLTPKHPSDTKVLTMKMEIFLEPTSNKLLVSNSLVHSLRALSTLRRFGLRTASAAAKQSVLTDPKVQVKMEMETPRSSGVMAAPIISISSDVSAESVGSSFPRVILIGSISIEVPVTPEVGVWYSCSHLPDDSESDTEMPEKHVSPTPQDAMLTR
ncbi:hypothetical protein Tco_0607037 [Tanacetum coccineum]